MESRNNNIFLYTAIILLGAFIGFYFLKIHALENPSAFPSVQNINLWSIFLTGLLTGGLTCLAVQGGLLAATFSQREQDTYVEHAKRFQHVGPIFAFLISKLAAYTFLGFLLGWFGSFFEMSLLTQIIMQVAVALFMIGTALNMLNVHPVFRYVALQPPKRFMRLAMNQSKSKSLFAPLLLGACTVFIPCGTTQAMMALAIGSANPFLGAAVLFAFVLGTSPLFFLLGYFATTLHASLHNTFMKAAAVGLIFLALYNLNNVLALTGATWSLDTLLGKKIDNTASNTVLSSDILIHIEESGYNPNSITVKSGSTITLQIKNDGVYSCASAFTIPYFQYQKVILAGETQTVVLTMPDKPTKIPFLCSMGMYKGVIHVI